MSGAPETPVRLVAAGDIACKKPLSCADAATAALIDPQIHEGVLALGDLQYHRGTLREFIRSYDKTWGPFREWTYPTPGNHEFLTPGAKGYFSYFPPGRTTRLSLSGRPDLGYYSFDVGGWHIVSLNSNCHTGRCSTTSRQMRWLTNDLAASTSRCTIAYWHHPRFSSGEHGNDERVDTLWRTVAAMGVDAVLTAHDHIYERFSPLNSEGREDDAGTVQFVVGTGGSSLRPVRQQQPSSRVLRNDSFGVLELSLLTDELQWRFLSTNGAQVDTGSLRCR